MAPLVGGDPSLKAAVEGAASLACSRSFDISGKTHMNQGLRVSDQLGLTSLISRLVCTSQCWP